MKWLSWIYPERCALCGRFDPSAICPTCKSEMDGLRVANSASGPDPVHQSVAAYDYTGRPAQAVRRLKYSRVLTHAACMAEELAEAASRVGIVGCDAFVPVPIHWTRQCERGFNQSAILAESLPNVEPTWLRRTRRTRQQVGLTPEMRKVNLQGAFAASKEVSGKWIVLVDDVTTSGGTARECAKALLDAGAYRVDLLTYCRGGAVTDA